MWLCRYVRNLAVITVLALILGMHNGFSLLGQWMFPTAHAARWRLINYVQSITTPYHDRTEGVVNFLRQAAQPGQELLVEDPEFPLQFYLPLRILDARLLTALHGLPNWILPGSVSGVLPLPQRELSPELRDQYDLITVRVPRSTRGGGIPNPDTYEFFTAAENYDLIVYKRKP